MPLVRRQCHAQRSESHENVYLNRPYPGKLLITPSRLLKLIIPLRTLNRNSDRKDIAPLALLVHPQRLVVPGETDSVRVALNNMAKGDNRVPGIEFRAKKARDDGLRPKKKPRDDIAHTDKSYREKLRWQCPELQWLR
jgi:hypothetical protein